MTTINTPTTGDEELKSRLEGLTDKQKDEILEIFGGLTGNQKNKLHEMLIEDKKLREKKESNEDYNIIKHELECLDNIINNITTMQKNIEEAQKEKITIYKSWVRKILEDAEETKRMLKEIQDKISLIIEGLSNENITHKEVRDKILSLSIRSCRIAGWINNIMILLSYSRIPELKDALQKNGIDVSLLENICSDITAMLNEINNMELIVPTVLTDVYNDNLHTYQNDDIWIDKFFPRLARRDYYKGKKIFEIVRIGYRIKDENIDRKPIVIY